MSAKPWYCASSAPGTAAHVDIGKALVLRQQRAGQRHQPVGHHKPDDLVEAGVDALCARHVGVAAGGADAAAELGAKEPVQNGDKHRNDDGHHKDRVLVERHVLDIAQRDEQVVFVDVDGLVGFAHDLEVDAPQCKLGQDTGQDRLDAHERMENTGDKPCQQTRAGGRQNRRPNVPARQHADHADRAAGAQRAVDGQVRNVEHAVGDVDADGHDGPDQALRRRTRQRVDQCHDIQKKHSSLFGRGTPPRPPHRRPKNCYRLL